jgi:carotenoid 1,2-hydratase
VFSPYYAWARRGDGLADPSRHCALNVALYGRPKRWAMTERGAARVQRDATHLAIGPSALSWDGTALTIRIEELAAPIPRPLRGTVRLHPTALARRQVALDAAGRHRWSPIAPTARVEVALDSPSLRWSGAAYFDTNEGDRPLERDFLHWDWCRAGLRDATAVLYEVVRADGDRLSVALRYDRTGAAEDFDPPARVAMRRGLWGVARDTRADASHDAAVLRTLEDAPFYTRSVIRTHLLGEPAEAVHESLSLTRFARPWVQAMLPFRIPRALR